MAGIDQEHLGEVHKSEGYSLGYLSQEPELDLNLSVKESVAQGAQHITDLLKEFDNNPNPEPQWKCGLLRRRGAPGFSMCRLGPAWRY